jgi:DNA polymerase elongation subunit (family B)
MATLVFDIETVGEDFDALDATTQEVLTRWIQSDSESEDEYEHALTNLKNEMGFSPLTGEIVAIGVLDVERERGAVYYQAPGERAKESEEDGIKFKPVTEKEMLEAFWDGASEYDEFVTFNGRCFDAPFLAVRSAIHGVRPTCDLLSNRYTSMQRGVRHIDLRDQLSFYGAMRRPGSLHLWCRAFGIESPKAQGVSGDDVATLYKEKKYLDIAKYNVGDLRATKELYERWKEYLRF